MRTILNPINYFCFILLFSISVSTSFSQLNWIEQNSGSTTQFADDVDFINDDYGWSTLYPNQVIRTTNGGDIWLSSIITGPGAVDLTAITFVDATTGYLLDADATVYKSLDGGVSWTPTYTNGLQPQAYEITFVDAQHGWVSRIDYILFTDDGGSTWDSVSNPVLSSAIEIEFDNLLVGYVMGAGNTIAVSNDGGQNWDLKTVPGLASLNDMSVVNETTVYVCSEFGKVLKTTNSGDTWTLQTTGLSTGLYGIHFFDELHGIAVGDQGKIITTTDGGLTWIYNTSPVTESIFGIDMTSPNTAWITGSGGTILHSEPGATDLAIDMYMGDDFACDETTVDIPVIIKNLGTDEIYEGIFVVTNSIGNLMLTYPWTGSLLPSEYESINLGDILINGTDSYTISFLGDSVITNNTYGFSIVASDHSSITVSETQIICPGDSVEINVFGGVAYEWLTLDAKDTLSHVDVSPNVDTYYPVKITYEAICEYVDTVLVQINQSCGGTNLAFSPNEDGVNDYLYIEGAEKISNKVIIFNRWGEEITSFTNYNNADIVWYGDDKNGKSLVEGTYFYVIETGGVMIDGVDIGKGGWVQIVK